MRARGLRKHAADGFLLLVRAGHGKALACLLSSFGEAPDAGSAEGRSETGAQVLGKIYRVGRTSSLSRPLALEVAGVER